MNKIIAEWSGSLDPSDPDNFWLDDVTGERVDARTGERYPGRGSLDCCTEDKTMTCVFDEKAGIRERLFLLSKLTDYHDTANWSYSPHLDAWQHVGGRTLHVRYEGTESLQRLAGKGIDRKAAMEAIGYPESR